MVCEMERSLTIRVGAKVNAFELKAAEEAEAKRIEEERSGVSRCGAFETLAALAPRPGAKRAAGYWSTVKPCSLP